MEHQEMNLNIRYDAGDEVWNKIPDIFSIVWMARDRRNGKWR